MIRHIFKEIRGIDIPAFPRMTWHEAMEQYGCDKPDIRFGMKFADLTRLARTKDFAVFNLSLIHIYLKQMWMSRQGSETVYISAVKKENIEELKEKLYDIVKEIHSARFPYNDFLYQDYTENNPETDVYKRQILCMSDIWSL